VSAPVSLGVGVTLRSASPETCTRSNTLQEPEIIGNGSRIDAKSIRGAFLQMKENCYSADAGLAIELVEDRGIRSWDRRFGMQRRRSGLEVVSDCSGRVCLSGQASSRSGRGQCGQATKGVWGMSWRWKAKKGVEDCDKPGGMVKRVLIPGSLNYLALNP
jgi:hypothetical protein